MCVDSASFGGDGRAWVAWDRVDPEARVSRGWSEARTRVRARVRSRLRRPVAVAAALGFHLTRFVGRKSPAGISEVFRTDCGPTHRCRHTRRAAVLGCRPNTMASAMASPWVQGIAAGRGRSLGDTARAKRRHRSTKRSMHHRISTQTNAGLLDALEVKVPKPSTVENVDEKNEFKSLMEKAGVRHQVRLASGSRGRGLFPTGPVGWTDSAMLLSVPLDVCICAPFGDEDAVANELGLNDGYKDTCTILRRAWQKRNGAKVPEAIVSLLDSDSGDDRELALALWVLWATEEGGEVWEAYARWLPKPDGSMPSLLLADDKELAQLQDDVLAAEARQIHEAMAAAHKKIALANADAKAMKGRTCREFTLDELKWGFALVASRAVASPVGDGASAAAIMVPFFDMANHDDRGYVSAIKSVRGTEDGDVENGIRVAVERAINQGVGGPRVVLETTRGLQNTDDEIVIQYDPDAANNELVLRYGFSLRGNRNEKLPRPDDGSPAATCVLTAGAFKLALEAKGLMREMTPPEDQRRLISVVANACLGLGTPEEDDAWELDEDACMKEAMDASALREHWRFVLDSFETSAVEDDALLTAAKAGRLPGATANIVCAVEYRMERKITLATGIKALDAYVEWLNEEDEEEEEEEAEAGAGGEFPGFEDQ